jgi:hypothetical protein
VLAVYRGSAVSSLTPVASNDDSCDLRSRTQFNATAGTTYRIAVDGFFGEQGSIRLELEQERSAPPPPRPPPPPPPPGALPSNEFSFGKVKKNKKRGTAKLTVRIEQGPGELELAKTKKVKPDDEPAEAAGEEKLSIKPSRKAKKKLNRSGKAKVKAEVTYTPDGGEPNTQTKRVRLIKRR